MAVHQLERLLVYTDKNKRDEFDVPEAAFDELYELFVETKDDVLDQNHTSVAFFNEVFYNLTYVYAYEDSAENINSFLHEESPLLPLPQELREPDSEQQINALREHNDWTEDINSYVMEFVWVVLKKQNNLPKHVRFFLTALTHALTGVEGFYVFEDFLKKHPAKHSISFEMKPEVILDFVFQTPEDWQRATKDFDKETVSHIVHRFHSIKDRENVISFIRSALDDINKKADITDFSMVTYRSKSNEEHLDSLLQESINEENNRLEQKQQVEKSKDDRIVELEEQIKTLKQEKSQAIREKEAAERKRDYYKEKLDSLTSRLNKKYIPASLKSEEAVLIINELIEKDVISPMGHDTANGFVTQLYRWDESGALFGYFVDKMCFQLELYSSGGNINWKEFKPAFGNFEEKIKRARDTVSYYRKHPEKRKPEKAEIIEEAIANAEKKIAEKESESDLPW